MKYLIIILLGLGNCFAVDFSLCREFLGQQNPRTYLEMNQYGKISATDQSQLQRYREDINSKTLDLFKSWDSSQAVSKNFMSVKVERDHLGEIKIDHTVGTTQEDLQLFNVNTRRRFSREKVQKINSLVRGGDNTQLKVKTSIKLGFKNNKCYPKRIYHRYKFPDGEKEEVYSISSETCLNIKKYFNQYESPDKVKSIDELHRLRDILSVKGKFTVTLDWMAQSEIMLSNSQKLFYAATRELELCQENNLMPTVNNERLWMSPSQLIESSTNETSSQTN